MHVENPAIDACEFLDQQVYLESTDPLISADEIQPFVPQLYQQLLHLLVIRDRLSFAVPILDYPGKNGHERAVGAAPAAVIKPILHVVKVAVISTHHVSLRIFHYVSVYSYMLLD